MEPLQALTQFGGLGVLALFSWAMLKSLLKQQEKLGNMLNNHLTSLLQRSEKTNEVLSELLKEHRELRKALKPEGK